MQRVERKVSALNSPYRKAALLRWRHQPRRWYDYRKKFPDRVRPDLSDEVMSPAEFKARCGVGGADLVGTIEALLREYHLFPWVDGNDTAVLKRPKSDSSRI